MIRTSPNTRRAAAVILAAAVLPFLAPRAKAQQVVDLFAGTLGSTSQLSISNPLLGGPAETSGNFGPGYTGTLALVGGANNTFSQGFVSNNGANSYFVSQTGVAALGGSASAFKTFGNILTANTTYSFTLTRSAAASISLLGSFGISLSNGNGAFLDTTTGQGLAGIVDVLGLFGAAGTNASFQFTTPTNYNPANGLTVTFTDNLPVGALAGSLVLSGASINQAVPEPGTVVAMLLGAGGLVVLRFRRRLAAA